MKEKKYYKHASKTKDNLEKIPVDNNRCHGPKQNIPATLSLQWKVLIQHVKTTFKSDWSHNSWNRYT